MGKYNCYICKLVRIIVTRNLTVYRFCFVTSDLCSQLLTAKEDIPELSANRETRAKTEGSQR